MAGALEFILTGRSVRVEDCSLNTTLLEYLRNHGMTGAKEGCAEGDCGACSVAIAARDANGKPTDRAINSCLLPVCLLAGHEIVSVEGASARAPRIEGGFVQGMGWLTNEELQWDDQGRWLTHSPDAYKIPSVSDTPPDDFLSAAAPEAGTSGLPLALLRGSISSRCPKIQKGPQLFPLAERRSRQRYGASSCWRVKMLLLNRTKPSPPFAARIGFRFTPSSGGRGNRHTMPRT
jgi:ferredoxin